LPNPPTIILLLKTESTSSLKQTLKRTRFSRPWSKGTIFRVISAHKRSNATHPHTTNLETEMNFHTNHKQRKRQRAGIHQAGKNQVSKTLLHIVATEHQFLFCLQETPEFSEQQASNEDVAKCGCDMQKEFCLLCHPSLCDTKLESHERRESGKEKRDTYGL